MACNENIIKNMANEITRNCQTQGVSVEADFVTYLIELLLLNPRYGKLFARGVSRVNLEFFVNECVDMITRGETSINTLKMQFVMKSNYDKPQKLVDRHLESIEACLRPLADEILEAAPDDADEAALRKLFRKISIYIVLSSGLGNPGAITTLKEGMGALESVFTLDELRAFAMQPRGERAARLGELARLAAGVRLFNRDCGRGGAGIADLPFEVVEAGKACLAALSGALLAAMRRVNSLTAAAEDAVAVDPETGVVGVRVPPDVGLTERDYRQIFELLAFNRQYEVYVRRLLADAEAAAQAGARGVERARAALHDLHAAVQYKTAVPAATVFPLFTKLWEVWHAMQNVMYLISTVNRAMVALDAVREQTTIPGGTLAKMLQGKQVISDLERMCPRVSVEERLSLGALRNYVAYTDGGGGGEDKHVQYLGFCAVCLCAGALVPGNVKAGLVRWAGGRYGFCSGGMAARFARDPQRYVNEVLEYARGHPHVIHLLHLAEDVARVKDVDCLVGQFLATTKVQDKDIQTETHPIESYIEKNYTWNMWEWKRRACQWATIVNCRTSSTQTDFTHFKSETHCQTVEGRDKCLQTDTERGVNTVPRQAFLWGLRGHIGDGQRTMDLTQPHTPDRKSAQVISVCQWPCVAPGDANSSEKTTTVYKET